MAFQYLDVKAWDENRYWIASQATETVKSFLGLFITTHSHAETCMGVRIWAEWNPPDLFNPSNESVASAPGIAWRDVCFPSVTQNLVLT